MSANLASTNLIYFGKAACRVTCAFAVFQGNFICHLRYSFFRSKYFFNPYASLYFTSKYFILFYYLVGITLVLGKYNFVSLHLYY